MGGKSADLIEGCRYGIGKAGAPTENKQHIGPAGFFRHGAQYCDTRRIEENED